MAEGWARHLLGDRFEAASAGTEEAHVDPRAIAVMAEIGIDLAGHRSKSVDSLRGEAFDHVFTLCGNAQGSCPVWIGAATVQHHGFEDPPRLAAAAANEDAALEHYRRVRDEIGAWIKTLPGEVTSHG